MEVFPRLGGRKTRHLASERPSRISIELASPELLYFLPHFQCEQDNLPASLAFQVLKGFLDCVRWAL